MTGRTMPRDPYVPAEETEMRTKSGDRSIPLDDRQFQLALTVTKCRPRKLRPPHSEMQEPLSRDPVSGIDQVLSTRDVERITGRHRCAIYRWVCAGTFPGKRAGGGKGWLRSDVERWLIPGGSGDSP
jgi:predicted DNA-binding transcriptional regulator AlpA